MVSVQSPPGGRDLSYARVLLLPPILMAAVTGTAVILMTGSARLAVGLCGAGATLLVLAVAALAARRGRVIHELRAEHGRRTALLEQRINAHDQEFTRLGKEILPAALYRLHGGEPPTEVIRHVIDGDAEWCELPRSQRDVVRMVLDIVDREEALRDSAQRSFVNIARRVQAIVHQQNKELREMEEDHGRNPEVFDDLLRIDHGTALIGRLADSIAVLGGSRPGRVWPRPVPLYSCLRGAMSRILEYRRIELHSIAKVNVNGVSVEPVIHACAELLDNATRYSPPHTKVHVTAVEVQTGIAIEIEDGGVSLTEESRAKVEDMLAKAQQGIDMQELGESPRLGLAVVGRLSTMYKMHVALRQSAYGGVRAVVVVPRDMLTDEPAPGLAHGIGAAAVPTMDTGGVEGPNRKPKRRRPTTGPRIPSSAEEMSRQDMDDDVPVVTEWTANGLPQRRSRMTIPLSQRYAEAAAAEAAAEAAMAAAPVWQPEPEPEKELPPPGMWVEAFMAGLKRDPDPDAFTRNPDDPTTSTSSTSSTASTVNNNESARNEADDEGDLK
ncbi:sensor histidine kinase [Streptomyces ipomoeae]|uniref:histidine kinase n=1 Tax=Streptomyces ipomoeae TaxID=103232 RepID=A0A540QMT7_9ACTN|nr:ATP-binding protein [Streptomyces ipomoeae]MDX2932165.1 sensor histidine kinase [Streptomyces ipomoeae]TQE23370.1 sensor histidine kinase [Streptomyces ipomoeae]TQE36747.1 sensor histidine kinase [Streptomyces ipomoeae]TQE38848.1 sensor histidine kinase [Streptomyces ipomoeae]